MAAILGDWMIDDAGISFAYSRNLAHGLGLVAQAGRRPLEGYSNFLWVLLCAPLFAVSSFPPLLAAKLLPVPLMFGTFERVQRMSRHATGRSLPGVLACVLLALSPPIVIWSVSGLENGLMLFLFAALLERAVRRPPHWRQHAGALTALMAMTHPEGVAYLACGLALSFVPDGPGPQPMESWVRGPLTCLGAFLSLFVPFIALRLALFHLPLPQTYYAKRQYLTFGEQALHLWSNSGALFGKLSSLAQGIAGPLGLGICLCIGVFAAILLARWKLDRPVAILAATVFLAAGAATFLWLEDDWMGELRFATVADAGFVVTAVLCVDGISRLLRPSVARLVVGAFAALALTAVPDALGRTIEFAKHAPTPYAEVERHLAKRLDAYAVQLGIKDGSMLVADIGAPLLTSRLRVYDLAGLIEPEVTATLKSGSIYWLDVHPAFYDWVFERVRPSFIATQAFWTQVAALQLDPRFARDYTAVDAYEDLWYSRQSGRSLKSGVFVRTDLLRPGDLERLRATPIAEARGEAWVDRITGLDREAPERLRQEAQEESAASRFPRAATLLKRLVELSSEDVGARQELALALDNAGRSEGRQEWQKVLALAQKAHDVQRVRAAQSRLESAVLEGPLGRAYLLYQAGRFQDAILATGELRKPDANSADAYNLLAVSYAALHMWQLAAENAGEALRLRPDFTLASNNLAWINAELAKETNNAVRSGAETAAVTPSQYVELSLALHQNGMFSGCIAAAKQAARLDPASAEALNNEGICNAGLRNWDEAIRAFQQALQLRPDFQLAASNLAWVLSEQRHASP